MRGGGKVKTKGRIYVPCPEHRGAGEGALCSEQGIAAFITNQDKASPPQLLRLLRRRERVRCQFRGTGRDRLAHRPNLHPAGRCRSVVGDTPRRPPATGLDI